MGQTPIPRVRPVGASIPPPEPTLEQEFARAIADAGLDRVVADRLFADPDRRTPANVQSVADARSYSRRYSPATLQYRGAAERDGAEQLELVGYAHPAILLPDGRIVYHPDDLAKQALAKRRQVERKLIGTDLAEIAKERRADRVRYGIAAAGGVLLCSSPFVAIAGWWMLIPAILICFGVFVMAMTLIGSGTAIKYDDRDPEPTDLERIRELYADGLIDADELDYMTGVAVQGGRVAWPERAHAESPFPTPQLESTST